MLSDQRSKTDIFFGPLHKQDSSACMLTPWPASTARCPNPLFLSWFHFLAPLPLATYWNEYPVQSKATPSLWLGVALRSRHSGGPRRTACSTLSLAKKLCCKSMTNFWESLWTTWLLSQASELPDRLYAIIVQLFRQTAIQPTFLLLLKRPGFCVWLRYSGEGH